MQTVFHFTFRYLKRSCTVIEQLSRQPLIRNMCVTGEKHSQWTAIQMLQLASKLNMLAHGKKHQKKRDELMELSKHWEQLGYEFEDFIQHWDQVSTSNPLSVTCATHSLLVECKTVCCHD